MPAAPIKNKAKTWRRKGRRFIVFFSFQLKIPFFLVKKRIFAVTERMIFLSQLKRGQSGRISAFRARPEAVFRFMEMGLSEGERARVLSRLPFGGNLIILLKNGKYTIRKKDADSIIVEPVGMRESAGASE